MKNDYRDSDATVAHARSIIAKLEGGIAPTEVEHPIKTLKQLDNTKCSVRRILCIVSVLISSIITSLSILKLYKTKR